jgi:hypothetical protein
VWCTLSVVESTEVECVMIHYLFVGDIHVWGCKSILDCVIYQLQVAYCILDCVIYQLQVAYYYRSVLFFFVFFYPKACKLWSVFIPDWLWRCAALCIFSSFCLMAECAAGSVTNRQYLIFNRQKLKNLFKFVLLWIKNILRKWNCNKTVLLWSLFKLGSCICSFPIVDLDQL